MGLGVGGGDDVRVGERLSELFVGPEQGKRPEEQRDEHDGSA